MASDPDLSREQLNDDLSQQELTAALIIRNQLKAIIVDATLQLKSTKAKQAIRQLYERIDHALVALLHAENKEAYDLQQKRFNELLKQFKEIMRLEGDAELALQDFRFFHHVHQTLLQTTFQNREELLSRFGEKFQDDPDYELWCRHFEALQKLPADRFEQQKNVLLQGLSSQTTYMELANLAAMGLVEKNAQILTDTRMIYLKETNDRKSLLRDIGWIGLGIGLVTAAAVLAIAFPVLAVPGIVVGSIVMGYGIIDFAKENVELYSELTEEEKNGVSYEGREKLKSLEHDIKDMDVVSFLRKQPHHSEDWSSEKKWVKGLGYGASFAGFALGIVALAFVLPGVAIPAAAVIAVTIIAVGIAALAGAVLGYKVYSEQKKLKETEQEIEQEMQEDEAVIDEAANHLLDASPSSDARMSQKLQQHDDSHGKGHKPSPVSRIDDDDDDDDEEEERQGDEDRGSLGDEHEEGDSQQQEDEEEDGDKPLPPRK